MYSESEMVASCIFTTTRSYIETWRICRGDINLFFIPCRRAGGLGGNYIHNVLKTIGTAVPRFSSPVICTIPSSDCLSFHDRY